MRQSNRFLGTALAFGVVAALALAPVSQAGEGKQADRSAAAKVHQKAKAPPKPGAARAGKRLPTESVTFTFQKVDAAFNPKEISIDKSVPWQKGGSRN